MKLECILFVCFVACISSTYAEKRDVHPKHSEKSDAIDIALGEHLLKEVNDAADESIKHKHKEKTDVIEQHVNKNESLAAELKHILANVSKSSNATDDEEVETSTPYNAKHYLTAEQKYYMLRINLLGIGIRVVHDIIPIPVANTDQYKTSMGVLLDKVQAVREASSNITAGNMHNITLEDAHKLQMEIARANETGTVGTTKKKAVTRTTEAMILVGVAVAIILIGVLVFVCRRARNGKSEPPYYDRHLQGGGAVPLN